MIDKPRVRVKARTAPITFDQWCRYVAKWTEIKHDWPSDNFGQTQKLISDWDE